MITLDCEQGSEEWIAARIGRPTASRFGEIMTAKTLKPSVSQDRYMAELLAEWALGCPLDATDTGLMQRGSFEEQSARSYYELVNECEVERPGFILRDDLLVGCSPDGLLPTGGLEMKVPGAKTHILYLLGGGAQDYQPQVQGCMWITERPWWDFLSWHPTFPAVLTRVARDEDYIAALARCVTDFAHRLEGAKQEMLGKGIVPVLNPFTPDILLQQDKPPTTVK